MVECLFSSPIIYECCNYFRHRISWVSSGANVWVRWLPECAIGHTPKIGADGTFVPNPAYLTGLNEPYLCVPDGDYIVTKDSYGGHKHLASYEDSIVGGGWYLVRRTHTAMVKDPANPHTHCHFWKMFCADVLC